MTTNNIADNINRQENIMASETEAANTGQTVLMVASLTSLLICCSSPYLANRMTTLPFIVSVEELGSGRQYLPVGRLVQSEARLFSSIPLPIPRSRPRFYCGNH